MDQIKSFMIIKHYFFITTDWMKGKFIKKLRNHVLKTNVVQFITENFQQILGEFLKWQNDALMIQLIVYTTNSSPVSTIIAIEKSLFENKQDGLIGRVWHLLANWHSLVNFSFV